MESTPLQQNLFDDFDSLEIEIMGIPFLVRAQRALTNGTNPRPCAVWIHYYGGGLTTGDPDSPCFLSPYFRKLFAGNTLMICLKYRLLPEHCGRDIQEDIPVLSRLILSGSMEGYIKSMFPLMKAPFQEELFVSGDSAGGHLAMYTWLRCPSLPIRAILFENGMFTPYARPSGQAYRGTVPSNETLRELAALMLEEAADRRLQGCQQRSRIPPDHMGNLPITATRVHCVINDSEVQMVSPWYLLFRSWSASAMLRYSLEEGVKYAMEVPVRPTNPPALELDTEKLAARLGPERLKALGLGYLPRDHAFHIAMLPPAIARPLNCPHMYFMHGKNDKNCPIGYTDDVVDMIETAFPGAVRQYWTPEEEHGFAHNMEHPILHDMAIGIKADMGWITAYEALAIPNIPGI
ncbi:hypothetical protein N0V90_012894 [Kalmusia sp. IMI 367209]|nr:hypothetical protein N0V90_012894 [Kalmusia sp. IMI 367209]